MKDNQKSKLYAKFLAGIASSNEEQKMLDTPEIKGMMQEQWDNISDGEEQEKPNLYRILANIYRRIASDKPTSIAKIRRMVYIQVARVAAVILLMLSLGYFSWQQGLFGLNSMVTVTATEGVRSEVFLPDGSRIWLNSGSYISYKKGFDEKIRRIKLSGEAYFNISTDPNRPLTVVTDIANVEVTGTRFHVVTNSSGWETTLMEGKVSVYPTAGTKTQSVVLSPGQKAQWNANSKNFTVNSVDASSISMGFSSRLRFDNESLGSIAHELEKTFGVKIDVPQAIAEKYRFTATFTDESIFEIFNLLKITAPIDFAISGNKVVVRQGTDM